MFRFLLIACIAAASAFKLPTSLPSSEQCKAAGVAAALSTMLVATPVSAGVPEAAIELTDAAYPIIGSLKKDTVSTAREQGGP